MLILLLSVNKLQAVSSHNVHITLILTSQAVDRVMSSIHREEASRVNRCNIGIIVAGLAVYDTCGPVHRLLRQINRILADDSVTPRGKLL